MPEELRSMRQIADRLDCSVRTVQRLIRKKQLTAVRLYNKKRMVRESDFQRFIASLPKEQ